MKPKEELLLMRICKRFDEINEMPIAFHWNCRMDEFGPSEEVEIGLAF